MASPDISFFCRPTGSPRRLRRLGRLLAATGIALLAAAGPAAALEDGRCSINREVLEGNRSLPRTMAALGAHLPLKVVALGSSSTQGYGASEPRQAYPPQLAAKLKLRFPNSIIKVANKGIGGDDTVGMVARFPKDVFSEKPDLVIWQTGTNDAIEHLPMDRFGTALKQGLGQLRARGIDVILMTPQFAPQFTEVEDYAGYLSLMRQIAAASGVPIFDRFTMTKAWMNDRHFSESPVLTKDGLHQTDVGYHCVAVLLADCLTTLVNERSSAAKIR